jgi:hypothetical protein
VSLPPTKPAPLTDSKWADPADDAANLTWTRELAAAMKPYATGRVHLNFIGDEGDSRSAQP